MVLSNKQALKMVKALLAFHPETAHVTNARGRLPLHVIALTEAPQANDIMLELIERYPRGLMQVDVDGNTPMHLAAAVNNITGSRTLVEHSYRQPQHIQNFKGRFPMDCSKNRSVIKALTHSPDKKFKKREALSTQIFAVVSTLFLLGINGVILANYFQKHLEHLDLHASVARGERSYEDLHPRDKRLYFMWCDGCGVDSHLFYFIVIIILFSSWMLMFGFVACARRLFWQSMVKYFELGWFAKHPNFRKVQQVWFMANFQLNINPFSRKANTAEMLISVFML